MAVQVVYGHVVGVLLFHDKETWFGVVGTILIAFGAIGANLFKVKPAANNADGQEVR